MRTVSVVCPLCRELVAVVEKQIAEHGECPASGMRYLPSPRVMKSGPGAPRVEIVAAKPLTASCENCGREHQIMLGLAKVSVPNPQNN